jgi:hypothetical protein
MASRKNDTKNNGDELKELDELEKDLGKEIPKAENESALEPELEVKPEPKPKANNGSRAQKKEGKRYTPDFKKMVAKEKKNGATYAELFKKYGVYASQIITWSKK